MSLPVLDVIEFGEPPPITGRTWSACWDACMDFRAVAGEFRGFYHIWNKHVRHCEKCTVEVIAARMSR